TLVTTHKHHYTRNVLLQMLVVFVLLGAAIFWQRDFLHDIYFKNQVSTVGWVINGGILLLFLLGMFRLMQLFIRYTREEKSLNRFIANVQQKAEPLADVYDDSLIAQRYETLKSLHHRRAQINHGALAATLTASESSYNSFPKFVHTVLILTGVFGTIVSLSIALLGASDMISAPATETGGLGNIIYGMSTALSTTMTAIVAYLIFGYFFIKLTDTQTYLISRIEEVTATVLLPHLQLSPDAVTKDYSDTVRAATGLVKRFDESQARYAETALAVQQTIASLDERLAAEERPMEQLEILIREMTENQSRVMEENSRQLRKMVVLLQQGFRLRQDG
ncbi:MAG: hypothetical protein U9Q71_05860, partial [Pseudomonadota bacterium]|nr:hypothetical protein [Pseudomonadota bacterium]